MSLNEAPSNKNIYESTYSNYTQQQQSQAMNNQYQQSQNTLHTNVVSQQMPQENNYNQSYNVQPENESFVSNTNNEIQSFDFNDSYSDNQTFNHDLSCGIEIQQ